MSGRQQKLHVERRLVDYPAPTPQPTPCRLWQGSITTRGGYARRGRERMSRWVWRTAEGSIPEGMIVRHKCDQPLCYRFDHLELGTPAENTGDMVDRKRVSRPAAKLTPDDVRVIRESPLRNCDLASLYGVDQSAISHLRHGRTWKGM